MLVDNGTDTGWINCVEDKTFIVFSYVFFGVIFFPTVFGNLLILASIAKFQHLRSNMHILIGNLAVSDLLIAISIILQVIGYFRMDLVTNKYFCLGQNAVFVISLGTSSYNILVLSVERFFAVKFPLKHRIMFTKRTCYALILICWMYHSTFAALPLVGLNNIHGEVLICDTDLVWSKQYDIVLFGGLLAIVILNGILCGYMTKLIIQRGYILRYDQSNSFRTRSKLNHLKRMKMTMVIYGVFAISWAPYLIVSVILVFHNRPSVRCSRQWCICLGVVNSATNWIIYGLANKSFREAFKAVLRCNNSVNSRGSVVSF